MLGLLEQILCWIKQIGVMVLSALVDVVNLVLAAIFGIVNALISAWPVGMPDLPSTPPQLGAVMGWVKWTPLPITAAAGLFLFLLGVEILWQLATIALRWAKVIDG